MEKKNYSPSEGARSNGLVTQISVFLENRPGTLREATSILSEAGINLRALNIAETSDYGVLRLITEDPERTAEVLREQALRVYKASGQDALVTNASAAQMEEWLALASFPVVLFAAECAQGTRLPSQYITKLLREWKKAGVTTVEEARRQRAAQRPAPVGLQYAQRAYTEDEMKKFTVDLSQYSEDKKP